MRRRGPLITWIQEVSNDSPLISSSFAPPSTKTVYIMLSTKGESKITDHATTTTFVAIIMDRKPGAEAQDEAQNLNYKNYPKSISPYGGLLDACNFATQSLSKIMKHEQAGKSSSAKCDAEVTREPQLQPSIHRRPLTAKQYHKYPAYRTNQNLWTDYVYILLQLLTAHSI